MGEIAQRVYDISHGELDGHQCSCMEHRTNTDLTWSRGAYPLSFLHHRKLLVASLRTIPSYFHTSYTAVVLWQFVLKQILELTRNDDPERPCFLTAGIQCLFRRMDSHLYHSLV